MKASTGLRNAMLVTGSFKSQMDGTVIKIYGGVSGSTLDALSADDALPVGATLLCTVSVGGTGTGVTFETTATGGIVQKSASESWTGTNVASGTATFFRQSLSSDAGASSTTEKRIQGKIGLAGEDLNLATTALVSAQPQPISFYSVALPTL